MQSRLGASFIALRIIISYMHDQYSASYSSTVHGLLCNIMRMRNATSALRHALVRRAEYDPWVTPPLFERAAPCYMEARAWWAQQSRWVHVHTFTVRSISRTLSSLPSVPIPFVCSSSFDHGFVHVDLRCESRLVHVLGSSQHTCWGYYYPGDILCAYPFCYFEWLRLTAEFSISYN